MIYHQSWNNVQFVTSGAPGGAVPVWDRRSSSRSPSRRWTIFLGATRGYMVGYDATYPRCSPTVLAKELAEQAVRVGGHDNVSVVLVLFRDFWARTPWQGN
nr:unnamed protein product [Digitaria exilis]